MKKCIKRRKTSLVMFFIILVILTLFTGCNSSAKNNEENRMSESQEVASELENSKESDVEQGSEDITTEVTETETESEIESETEVETESEEHTEAATESKDVAQESTKEENTSEKEDSSRPSVEPEKESETPSQTPQEPQESQKPEEEPQPEEEPDSSESTIKYSPEIQCAIDAGYYNVAPFTKDDGTTGYTVMVHIKEGQTSNLDNVLMWDFLAEKGLKVSFTYGGLLTYYGEDMWFCIASTSRISEMTDEEKEAYKDKTPTQSVYHTSEDGTVYYDDLKANGRIYYMEEWHLSNGKTAIVQVEPEWLEDEDGNAYYIKEDGTVVYPGFAYPFD